METTKEETRTTALVIPYNILVEQALAAEFAEVCRAPVEGIFVCPSARNRFAWFGVIFVRKGIFGGGIFRFTIEIPSDFPASICLPRVVFSQSIFHPLICSKNKELSLARSFPDGWKREKHSLKRVLVVIQRSFYSYDVDSDKCINSEASVLYKEHRDKFQEIAKECVESSRSMVYDDVKEQENDPNGIRLLPWDALVHKTARKKMIQTGDSSKTQETAADFRREHIFSKLGYEISEIVGRSYPQSYSWFDPAEMTVITRYDDVQVSEVSPVTSARLEREKHGIEPLDLSVMSIEDSSRK
ncbi:hypothetical protein GCK72_022053 [Caenorhabditis remanei]|uniref:UBC core domain-containing protein n=1 Tax=Caenorhabditis remanei TaxID=31234 RepID=A0A6A5GLD2_CAERE|nr:hypothetical protein GCK72_022053 [Caenorhabditis remanei]KAF1755484.1 hypothetical protein GCK72_022053 [Caenorhabditis remanei]